MGFLLIERESARLRRKNGLARPHSEARRLASSSAESEWIQSQFINTVFKQKEVGTKPMEINEEWPHSTRFLLSGATLFSCYSCLPIATSVYENYFSLLLSNNVQHLYLFFESKLKLIRIRIKGIIRGKRIFIKRGGFVDKKSVLRKMRKRNKIQR